MRRTLVGIIIGGIIVAVAAVIISDRVGHQIRVAEAEQAKRDSVFDVSLVSDEGTVVVRNLEDTQVRHASLALICEGREVRRENVRSLEPGAVATLDFRYDCDGEAGVKVSSVVLEFGPVG